MGRERTGRQRAGRWQGLTLRISGQGEPTPADTAASCRHAGLQHAGCALGGVGSPLQVMSTRALQSSMREARASEEKPPNTTECTAPMRAHASCGQGGRGRRAPHAVLLRPALSAPKRCE